MSPRILIWLARRDLRLADNPILHEVSKLNSQSHAPFTHLLPLYVFPAQQIEISGFLKPEQRSPYPEARSEVGKYWRCGHHRVKFIAESVWDLKKSLEGVGSGLEIRVGMLQDVVAQVLDAFKDTGADVAGVWMTSEPGVEEKREERAVQKELERRGKEFKLVSDEKYFIDEYVQIDYPHVASLLTILEVETYLSRTQKSFLTSLLLSRRCASLFAKPRERCCQR